MLRAHASRVLRAASWAVGVWVVVGLGPAGCHRIAGYSQAQSQDATARDLTSDRPTALHDQGSMDSGPPGDLSPDTIDWLHCLPVDIPDPASLCSLTCAATPASPDTDCDGIPDARDPQADVCNALMVNGDLTQPSDAPGSPLLVEQVKEGCAAAEMGKRSKLVVANPPTSGSFVVEARFTLGQVWDPNKWWVALHVVPFDGSELINCELWVHYLAPPEDYQQNPGIHSATSNCGGSWTGSTDLPDDIGTVYTLQARWDGATLHCRLFDEGDAEMAYVSHVGCITAPYDAPLVHLVTVNRDATAHYLRVYELK